MDKACVGCVETGDSSLMIHSSMLIKSTFTVPSLVLCFVLADAGSPAEQGEDVGEQPNSGGTKPRPAAPAGAQEGAAHQALRLPSGEV